MPIPEVLHGDRWTERIGRRIVPLLVWCAEHRQVITYGELNEEVVRRRWDHHVPPVQYGKPAGAIGDGLRATGHEWGARIPPLNALVVNEETHIPGSGCDYFLSEYLPPYIPRKHLSLRKRRDLALRCIKLVWRYRHWDDLLDEYGMKPLEHGPRAIGFEVPLAGWGRGESPAHRRLKEYVSSHPELMRMAGRFSIGETEARLPSGDRIDVLFKNQRTILGIECKPRNAPEADLSRGIFQCIKYREVIKAWEKVGNGHRKVDCYLVSEQPLPISLKAVANTLGVKCFVLLNR